MTATRALRWLRSSHARFIGLILLLELVFGGALLLSVTQLVHASLDALVRQDSALARDVCRMDEEIDQIHRKTYDLLKQCR